jgi:hypothetical protein
MELNLSMEGLDSKGLSGDIHEIIRKGVELCAIEWQNEVKRIISDSKVDTGEFLNSVHYEIIEDGDDFIMKGFDGVNYGIYIEQGTVEHWVPFYKFGDTSQPILADWGKRVLGLSEEEMLKMGGIKVSQTGIHSFEKGLIKMESEYQGIFRNLFDEMK